MTTNERICSILENVGNEIEKAIDIMREEEFLAENSGDNARANRYGDWAIAINSLLNLLRSRLPYIRESLDRV